MYFYIKDNFIILYFESFDQAHDYNLHNSSKSYSLEILSLECSKNTNGYNSHDILTQPNNFAIL